MTETPCQNLNPRQGNAQANHKTAGFYAVPPLVFSRVMSNDGKKVVWILGSGFSKSLGGPLLADLFSHQGEAFVAAKFPELDRTPYTVFRKHLKGHPNSAGLPIYWEHAEQFLDFVSTAAPDTGKERYAILVNTVFSEAGRERASSGDLLQALRTNTVRCLAAECLFTTHSTTRSEPWGPYIKWARALREGDTIITFNYDMVLERLAAEHDQRFREVPNLKFGLETVVNPLAPDTREGEEAGVVKILKLHGSVGWFLIDHAFATAATDTAAAEQLKGNTIPFILGPGPDKLLHQEGTLNRLWTLASDAIKEAAVIVFLGYRFPPSDSQSRLVLLNAIREADHNHLRIHTVLGPQTGDENTTRMTKLLEHTLRGAGRIEVGEARNPRAEPRFFEIVSQPLYVEDFLTVVHPRELYGEVQQGLVLTGREGAELTFAKETPYFDVLDTDPDLQQVAIGPGGGISSAFHPEPADQAARLNSRGMTVWCDFELHNRSAHPLRNVTVELEVADARLEVLANPGPNVIVDEVEGLPGGGRILQNIRQINPWDVERLVALGVRPYGSARPNEVAESHGKFVVKGEAGIVSMGRFVVRCKVGDMATLTLRQAVDLKD